MADLNSLKSLINQSVNELTNDDGLIKLTFKFAKNVYEEAAHCSNLDYISGVYTYEQEIRKRGFGRWDDLPESLKDSDSSVFTVEMNIKDLRQAGMNVYFDEKELVELSPSAPERFIIIKLLSNSGLCSICPDDYNKNEIQRYMQVRIIWDVLRSCSDHENGKNLIFLYQHKLSLELSYTFDDLSNDFDGLRKLQNIFSNNLHESEKRNLFQTTLYSFLWRTSKVNYFKKILTEFPLFVQLFEENYHSFSVGFSFDKIRKEYNERFREYLSRLNVMIYDTLTRSLTIPITGLVSFIAMKGGFNASGLIVNIAALLLIIFSTIAVRYMIKFQQNMLLITQDEYHSLFKTIRDELKELELKELEKKETALNCQSKTVSKVLHFVHGIALSNLVINFIMFIITTF